MANDAEFFEPPRGPPPLLSEEQISSLCRQGWLLYDLPLHLKADIDKLNTMALTFFGDDAETKIAALHGKNFEEEGWFDVPGEKEYVTFRRTLNVQSSFQEQASHVWAEVTRLLHRVLCDLSRAGGLPWEAWDSIVADSMSLPAYKTDLRDVTSLLRLFKYLPGTGVAEQHTDLGLLTLCVGTGAGLEVLDRWQRPPAWIDGSKCTILVGETLRRLSQGNIGSGVHRVVGNPSGRQSFVFALRPNLRAVVDAGQFGGEGDVALREVFAEIKGSKYNVNARPDVREQQKERQRGNKSSKTGWQSGRMKAVSSINTDR